MYGCNCYPAWVIEYRDGRGIERALLLCGSCFEFYGDLIKKFCLERFGGEAVVSIYL